MVQQAIDLIYERYRDFGPTQAHEKLVEVYGLKLSDESVRKIMIAEGRGPSARCWYTLMMLPGNY